MKEIRLVYNPYSPSTSLYIQAQACKPSDGRTENMIVGKRMDEWLNPCTVSYKRWRGLLVELMELTNDDELAILFIGLQSDFNRLRDALDNQREAAMEAGYGGDEWTLDYLNDGGYSPETVRTQLQQLRKDPLCVLPTQELAEKLSYQDLELFADKEASVSDVCNWLERYAELAKLCFEKSSAEHRNAWENALAQLRKYVRLKE